MSEGATAQSHLPASAGLAAAGQAIPVSLLAALPGLVFFAGFDHLAYGLGLLAGVVMAGLLVAPRIARMTAATIPEALDRRFGKPAAIAGAIVVVLVALSLLTAELALVGLLAEAVFGAPYRVAVIAAAILTAGTALWVGSRGMSRLAIVAYVLIGSSLLLPLVPMTLRAHGVVVPQIAYGEALSTVAGLEEKLLENGLVDFETFSVHVTPFLRFSELNFVALVLSLALGIAVLPQLVSALAAQGRAAAVRIAGAWAALFAMLVLITVPALAAYAKLEIYEAIAGGTPLASLPAWIEAPLDADAAHIYGTSPALLGEVVTAASTDPTVVAERLATHAVHMEGRWRALAPEVQTAIAETAATLAPGASRAEVWQAYVERVLPAAAAAAGNGAATLTQAALLIEPAGLLLALPGLSGVPAWAMFAGMLSAGLVFAVALTRSLLSAAGLGASAAASWRAPVVMLGASAVAAGLTFLRPVDLAAMAVASLSLAAAGLFPTLAMGLAWKRATAAGAAAAIVAGAGVTLYYDVGTQAFPVAFYRTWAPLSNASEFAIEQFNALSAEAQGGESDAAKADAARALEATARGTPTRPGLANWFGIDSACGAVFGVPVGLITLVFVSLLTRTRTRQSESQP